MTISLQNLALRLDEAVLKATATGQLTHVVELTIEDAYAVQRAGIDLRAGRADRPVGVKLGFTSRAKAAQMGVSDVILGTLTESMRVDDGGSVDCGGLIHPRVEPELAFRLGRDLNPDDPASDPLLATTEVAPALEIIDSRYQNFTFTLPDVIADNASAAGFAIGTWSAMEQHAGGNLENAAVVLEIDGRVVETGSTAAILGDPFRALTAVKRIARNQGVPLPAGTIILAGAATAAVPLPAGSVVQAMVAGVGRVLLRAERSHGTS
uniref:2-keto-4-pentenoate hydratase n=1 Tax=Nonomuraea bangladeshensis TaxID=404385 RepID=UPI003F497BB0